MKKIYIRFINIFLLTLLFCSGAVALELDMSVDDEIRKNYNPSKLEMDALPPLPEIKQTQTQSQQPKPTAQPVQKTVTQAPKEVPEVEFSNSKGRVRKDLKANLEFDDMTAIKLNKGTKFSVQSQTKLSDYNSEGAGFTFVSLKPVTKRYVTIPQGTVFKGVIENSHQPQITGNGGLLELRVNKMIYKGSTYTINAKITKADGKKIFFNNIKGKRQYWNGVSKQIDKGEKFYQKTRRASNKLAQNPVGLIIAPIPTITGIATYAVNFVGSPIFSIGNKGSHITLPAGTNYQIKLLDDVYLH